MSDRNFMRSMHRRDAGSIDALSIHGDRLSIGGWFVPAMEGQAILEAQVNGQFFEQVEFGLTRRDIGRIFWFADGAESGGFSCATTIDPNAMSLDLRLRDARQSDPEASQNYYYPLQASAHIPTPGSSNRRRVHGNDSLQAFLLEGYGAMRNLLKVLAQIKGKSFKDFQTILDWGCGCGRVARFVDPGAALHGIDIDDDNVQWCRQNLSFGKYDTVGLRPKTALPDNQFDLIYGVSVFTHLTEANQFLWLEELARLAKPSAILLLSTHGETTACRSGLPANLLRDWRQTGFMDVGPNPDLDDVISASDYYKNTFHTEAYIRQHWQRWFDILDFVPGCIGNHQDLVVLQLRA